jgi:hypothetical protein
MATVFSVLITDYEDDYKHRYDNGVYPREIKLFSTLKKAENYAALMLYNEIKDKIEEGIFDNQHYKKNVEKFKKLNKKELILEEVDKFQGIILFYYM